MCSHLYSTGKPHSSCNTLVGQIHLKRCSQKLSSPLGSHSRAQNQYMWVVQVKTEPYVFEIIFYSLKGKGIYKWLSSPVNSYVVNLQMLACIYNQCTREKATPTLIDWNMKISEYSFYLNHPHIKILTCVCVSDCLCVTEVGCSWGGTRLVTCDLRTSNY